MNFDWQTFFFEHDWLGKLDRLAVKRFGDSALASEAANHAFTKMSEDEWKKLAGYEGKAKPDTYLRIVCGTCLEEFSRMKFGRPRPPKWLEDRGPLWVNVWKMVCIERQHDQTVIDRLAQEFAREKQLIIDALRTVRGKLPWCGYRHQETSESEFTHSDSTTSILEQATDDSDTPDNQEQSTLTESLFLLTVFLNQHYDPAVLQALENSDTEPLSELLQRLADFKAALSLTDDELIVIKMRFQDGLKKNVIAHSLSIPAYQPGRIEKSALKKIGKALQASGVNFDDVKSLVQEHLT